MAENKKSIQYFLIQNYVAIFIFTAVGILMAYGIAYFAVRYMFFGNQVNLKLEAKDVYVSDYKNMDIEDIEELGGWVEILNRNKELIFVKGSKKDSITKYDEKFLFNNFIYSTSDNKNYPYFYSIYSPQENDGNALFCIVKIPRSSMQLTINFTGVKLPRVQYTIKYLGIPICLLISVALFILGLYIFSKRAVNRIQVPLSQLGRGIAQMAKENYKTRLDFEADKEFAAIRDAFNDMAVKLDAFEQQKRSLADSKHRMIVNISHDLKTPVTSIQGYAHALFYGHVTNQEDKNKFLKYIYDKSFSVTRLINNLFELSKLQDNEFRLQLEKADFAEWLRQFVIQWYPEIEQKKFNLDAEITEQPIIINFDEKQMSRAFMNLMDNALKYNPEGTTLQIQCYRHSDMAIIRFADTGIGIAVNKADKLFNAFERGLDSAKNNGSGLGLAIVKEIIDKHHGTIRIGNDENYKTIFTIELQAL